ncbi:MAG: A24 family peptidase [Anaerolineae bacterium]|nr:A24 family peptidase [Anaerolineae bacterium]
MLFPLPLVFIIGLLVGAVINWLADYLPHYQMPKTPRYPDGETRPPVAWMGLTAFLLGKRASSGGAKLSWRYPLIEIVTAVALVLTVVVASGRTEMSQLRLVFLMIYIALFVLITLIDVEHKLILFSVIIPSLVIGLIDAIVDPYGPPLENALIGAAVGFGVFFLMYLGGFLFTYVLSKSRGQEINEVAFGYGDVMLITLSGLLLGWQNLLIAMFITVFLGAAGALLYIIFRRLAGSRYSMFTALPYGPYIVIATTMMLLFASEVGGFVVGAR